MTEGVVTEKDIACPRFAKREKCGLGIYSNCGDVACALNVKTHHVPIQIFAESDDN